MKRSDFWYNYIGHRLKYFTIQSNQGCCHGSTFVKSGSLVKNDQNQQLWLKIKAAASEKFLVECCARKSYQSLLGKTEDQRLYTA